MARKYIETYHVVLTWREFAGSRTKTSKHEAYVDVPSTMHGAELSNLRSDTKMSRICMAFGMNAWPLDTTYDDDGRCIRITLGYHGDILAEFVGEYEVEDYDCDTYSDTEYLPDGLDQVYGADTDLP